MSHHLDSPIARQDIRLDIADLYVFRGEVGTASTPGFHLEDMYEFKIDLDSDVVENLTYRVTFGERVSLTNNVSRCNASRERGLPSRSRQGPC